MLEERPYELVRIIVPLLLMLGCRKGGTAGGPVEHVDLERRV